MPKAKINTSVGSRRKKAPGTAAKKRTSKHMISVKTGAARAQIPVAVKPILSGRKKAAQLIASMNLDEMLEASKTAEMGIRGEKISGIKSPKVQKYVEAVLQLDQQDATKPLAKEVQQALTVQIVDRNRQTTDAAEAQRLYYALMKEE